MLAVFLVAVLIGVVFAVVYAWLGERIFPNSAFARSVHLAAVGYAVIVLLPMVKYPGNPPGVGDPGTVNQRTAMYLSLIVAGPVVAALTHWAYLVLARRGWATTLAATTVGIAAIAATGLMIGVWPTNPDAIPADVPAALLWQWRLSSLLELTSVWAVLGVAFGMLIDPAARSRSRPVTAIA